MHITLAKKNSPSTKSARTRDPTDLRPNEREKTREKSEEDHNGQRTKALLSTKLNSLVNLHTNQHRKVMERNLSRMPRTKALPGIVNI